jgi:hypothetical protein
VKIHLEAKNTSNLYSSNCEEYIGKLLVFFFSTLLEIIMYKYATEKVLTVFI